MKDVLLAMLETLIHLVILAEWIREYVATIHKEATTNLLAHHPDNAGVKKDTTDMIAALIDGLTIIVVPTINFIQVKQINVLNASASGSGNKVAQKQNAKLQICGEAQLRLHLTKTLNLCKVLCSPIVLWDLRWVI